MSEIEQVKKFIEESNFPGLKTCLQTYLRKLEQDAARAEEAAINSQIDKMDVDHPVATKPVPVTTTKNSSVLSYAGAYIPVENFSWDQGSYNSPTITIYVEIPSVGSVKDNVSVEFGKHSFDLKVHGLNDKNYRLVKDNLEKDIVPSESKFTVKKDKVVIKLQKVKGEYSYESWSQLTAKKPRDAVKDAEKKSDPMGGLMDMMKDMYEEGDDNMKKIIGEAMMKSKSGERPDPPSFGKDFDM